VSNGPERRDRRALKNVRSLLRARADADSYVNEQFQRLSFSRPLSLSQPTQETLIRRAKGTSEIEGASIRDAGWKEGNTSRARANVACTIVRVCFVTSFGMLVS
jgi:hypothetical protein